MAIAALVPAGFAGETSAQVPIEEVRVGVLAQSCCGPGADKEEGVGLNAEAVFYSPRILTVLLSPRPVVGVTAARDADATSVLYAGLDWRVDLPRRFFLTAGGGGAIHDGETDTFDPVDDAEREFNTLFLGCRALFRIASDFGYEVSSRLVASVHWSHISNAGLCDDNEGLDHLGVRLGLRF